MPTPETGSGSDTRIIGGIEFYEVEGRGGCESCARCGSSVNWMRCPECDGGYTGHDCGEDTCACLNPEDNVVCFYCEGAGGSWHCLSSPEFCKANPLPGREHIPSTALRSDAWND